MPDASTDTAAAETLLRHQSRRSRGMPTVSVLVSNGGAAYEIWTSHGYRPPRRNTLWSTQHPLSLTRAFTAELVKTAGVFAPAVQYLASFAKRAPQEIALTAASATEYSLRSYLESLGIDANFLPLLLFCLGQSSRNLSVTDQASVVHSVLGGDRIRVTDRAAEVAQIWGLDALPAIWIAADGPGPSTVDNLSGRVAPLAAAIAERVPQIPIAIAVGPWLWETYLVQAADSRAKTILRQGECIVAPPTNPSDESKSGETGNSIDADGARSEAERFLFAQLQANTPTTGLFELNAKVQGLDGRCREVDLLCHSYAIALEIDGYYHFENLDAYRRDRTKDVELQKLGYLVLRVLADDVVARLECVLRTVNEALATQRVRSNHRIKEPNGTTIS